MHLHDGVHHQQGRITTVALHVQVVQVFGAVGIGLQVLVFISLPCVESEVLGIKDKTSKLTKVELRLRLNAEAAAHVIVTFNDVEIVTLGATQ